jgi:hypothetical protein
MVDSTSLPVIADCDTGFGNAINVIPTVQDFEAAGVAAISIEDNVFPKRCSFYAGVARELAPVEEHAGKVRAAKSAQRSGARDLSRSGSSSSCRPSCVPVRLRHCGCRRVSTTRSFMPSCAKMNS